MRTTKQAHARILSLEEENYYLHEKTHQLEIEIASLKRKLKEAHAKNPDIFDRIKSIFA